MRENITTHETGPAQGSRISIPLLKKWDGEEFDLVQVSKPLALLLFPCTVHIVSICYPM